MLARVKQDLAARLDAPHAGFIAGAEAVFAVLGLVAYFDFLDSRRDASAQQQPLRLSNNAPSPRAATAPHRDPSLLSEDPIYLGKINKGCLTPRHLRSICAFDADCRALSASSCLATLQVPPRWPRDREDGKLRPSSSGNLEIVSMKQLIVNRVFGPTIWRDAFATAQTNMADLPSAKRY